MNHNTLTIVVRAHEAKMDFALTSKEDSGPMNLHVASSYENWEQAMGKMASLTSAGKMHFKTLRTQVLQELNLMGYNW